MKVVRYLFGLCMLADVAVGALMIDWWVEEYRELGYFSDMYPSIAAICCLFLAIDIGSMVKLKKSGKRILVTSAILKIFAFSVVLSVDFFATGEKDAGIGWVIISALFFLIYLAGYFGLKFVYENRKNTALSNVNMNKFGGFKSEWLWEEAAAEYCESNGIFFDDLGDDDNDKIYYYCSVQIAYLFAWLAKRGFLDESESVGEESFDEVKNGSCDPAEFFYISFDAALASSDLKDEIIPFMNYYCSDLDNIYMKDYYELTGDGGGTKLCRNFSWVTYYRFEKLIDRRHKQFSIDVEFRRDYFNEFYLRYYVETASLYSEDFNQDAELEISNDAPAEYVDKCKSVFRKLPDAIIEQIEELINLDFVRFPELEEGERYTAEMFFKGAREVSFIIPKPYGSETAFILTCSCDFTDERLAVMVFDDKALDIEFVFFMNTPWAIIAQSSEM